MRRRRITVGRKQRRVGLAVVIKAHRQQARQGVIGREREFERSVAAAGRTGHRGYVAADGCLLAVREIETQVKRRVEAARPRTVGRSRLVLVATVVIATA